MTGVLTAVGLTEIYRLGPTTRSSRGSGSWSASRFFALALLGLRRDYRVLENYKYLFGIAAIALLFLPRVPGLGDDRERRAAVGARRPGSVPAGRAREDLPDRLPRRLPAREARGARAGAAEGPRPAARRSGAAACSCSSRRTTSGRGSSTSGSSSRCCTSRPRGSRSWSVGIVLFVAGGVGAYEKIPHVKERVTIWLHPWTTHEVLLPERRAPGALSGRTARATSSSSRSTRSRTAASAAPGSARAPSRRTDGKALIPYVNTRLHLLGARAGARPHRRRRAAARLHAVRRARNEGRAAGRRRLLEAARRRADVRLRRCRRSSSSAACCA